MSDMNEARSSSNEERDAASAAKEALSKQGGIGYSGRTEEATLFERLLGAVSVVRNALASFSEVLENLREKADFRIVLAVLAVVFVGVVAGTADFGEPSPASYRPIYDEYEAIFAMTESMVRRAASESEWNAFQRSAEKRLTPIVSELELQAEQWPQERTSGIPFVGKVKSPGAQLRINLIQLGKWGLPRVIRESADGNESTTDRVTEKMTEALAMIDGSQAFPGQRGGRAAAASGSSGGVTFWSIVAVDVLLLIGAGVYFLRR